MFPAVLRLVLCSRSLRSYRGQLDLFLGWRLLDGARHGRSVSHHFLDLVWADYVT